jgi:integrase
MARGANLTEETVDAAACEEHRERSFFWDAKLKGFGLMVTARNSKSYVIQYRNREPRSCRYTIGKHGSPWTCEDARHEAKILLAKVTLGGDPMGDRCQLRNAHTVSELIDLYLAEGPAAKPNKKASSWRTDRANLNNHVKPLLGYKKLVNLTRADLERFQRDVALGKTAAVKTGPHWKSIVRGGRGVAARALATVNTMLEFAVKRKLLASHPGKGVELYKSRERECFLTPDELKHLADTLSEMVSEGSISATAANIIQLLTLTGLRRSEAATLAWQQVDFARRVLRLPDSKTGKKDLPLSDAALSLLAAIHVPGAAYVFPADSGDGHIPPDALRDGWEKLRTRAGLPGLRLHDLRHSFASFAVEYGVDIYLVSKMLGQKDLRSTLRYAHVRDDVLRRAVNLTAGNIAAEMCRERHNLDGGGGENTAGAHGAMPSGIKMAPLGKILAFHRVPAAGGPTPQRALAERLVSARKPDGGVYTRAEIEAEIVRQTGCTREIAQSAATKAVKRLDPDNPARRTHRRPVARRVDDGLIARMWELVGRGMSLAAIGREMGADPKTVRKHLMATNPPV